ALLLAFQKITFGKSFTCEYSEVATKGF
ncbi:MAG: hypothetical protein ACI93L_003480, partial [Cyclobacteriaceae bacterium]